MDAAVLNGGRHGITGRRKLLRTLLLRIQVVLTRVHKRLGVLNAYPHGKGFLFQSQPLRQHHAVHVPCAVPGSQQNGIRREFPAIRTGHAAYAAAVRRTEQMLYTGIEMNFPARAKNGFPDGFDDIGQQVGADMRMSVR